MAQAELVGELERGREAYASRAWRQAYESLSSADAEAPLAAQDLERLASAAYMLGREDAHLGALERAHRSYLDNGETQRAVRCAFWIGINLLLAGESSRAAGWFARAGRLLEHEERDCVERGYLLIPALMQAAGAREWEAASATAAEAAEIGERFGDPDLLALAVHEQGHALVRLGQVEEGLGLLDEAMVAVTAGELSPIATGLVYCSVIAYCRELHELRRAREWTDALSQWCERQPDMVAHTGVCLVHRAELMELGGEWHEALEEARRAEERLTQVRSSERAAGDALYVRAEIHRLRGELEAAEDAYREASRCGREPQPGLALLRLAQGRDEAAAVAIRRALGEAGERLERARLLPASVEILLAAGELEEARRACRELEEIAAEHTGGVLVARAALARGAVALAEGDAGAALAVLREACRAWRELDAPYELARSRALAGAACSALGDEDAAALELEAARTLFRELGAVPDLARLEPLTEPGTSTDSHGLTERELEVLRLVAAGRTNKAIAAELVVSERTVDRHVSNVLTKLRVPSRAAATAYAYEHRLLRRHQ